MSLSILDTDIVSLFQRGHPRVEANVLAHPASAIAISVLTVEEQLSGWYSELRRAKTDAQLADIYERMAQTESLYAMFPILSFTLPAIVRYESLKSLKINIGKTDLRIAAIALEANAIVVTRNQRDFGRVPNLVIEDWSL